MRLQLYPKPNIRKLNKIIYGEAEIANLISQITKLLIKQPIPIELKTDRNENLLEVEQNNIIGFVRALYSMKNI